MILWTVIFRTYLPNGCGAVSLTTAVVYFFLAKTRPHAFLEAAKVIVEGQGQGQGQGKVFDIEIVRAPKGMQQQCRAYLSYGQIVIPT